MKKCFFLPLFVFLIFTSDAQRQDDKGIEPGDAPQEYALDPRHIPSLQINSHSLPRHGMVNGQLNSKPLFSANVQSGKLHGSWISWYQNGMPCDSGSFVKGLPNGVWRYWDADGQLVALRTYSSDKYHRIRNEMLRYNSKRVSYPLVVLSQANKQLAMKYMDVRYSFGNAASKGAGWSLTAQTKRNITAPDTYRPVFDRALHHGLFMNFSRNGIVEDSGYYKNGLRDGFWIYRDSIRQLTYKGVYFHGLKIKEWKAYDAGGKLREFVFYSSQGKLKWRKQYP